MRILITGATGFVGSHLLEKYLTQEDIPSYDLDIYATTKFRSDTSNIEHLKKSQRIKWSTLDITDAHSVEETIKDIKPDVIHHLAGQSYVQASWQYPAQTFEINVIGSIHLFEAVRKYAKDAIVHVASSSEVYGIPSRIPIDETMLPNPCSPYGVSKLTMDRLAAQYWYSYGLKSIITRAFNHTGPRRGDVFVTSTFAKQIAEIEKGLKEKLKVGNLDARRDFTDVRDICDAYILAVKKCAYGEPYNICSGKSISIKDMLNRLASFSTVPIQVELDLSRMRPSDLHTLKGDCSKFKVATGWQPKYLLDQTLKDLLNYWRGKV